MTQDRRAKRAIRSRMARTGEKYTEARRALAAAQGGSSGTGGYPAGALAWPEDSLGWFTEQAYNLILLAEDEARMLSHPTVEPEHLLLATARHGNAERLLGQDAARSIHDALVAINGFGEWLELRPRRSPASEEALHRAVMLAAERGILGPSTEHLLLALAEQDLPARILAKVGVPDARALVDTRYPVTRPPVADALIQRRAAQLAAHPRQPPSPGPIPPIFERFTSQARDAVNAGIEHARELNDPYVEPVHLLLGVLHAQAGLAARLRLQGGWEIPAAALERPRAPHGSHQRWTDIFSFSARRIVAEDVLSIAERIDHRALTTGHLLLAILEDPGERAREITRTLPDVREITAAVSGLLPSDEQA